MKTKLFTLALLLISAGSFAQKAFTQATLNEILAEYKTNSKAFFTNRLSDDFRYTTPKGAYQNRTDVVSGNAQKILKVEIAEPVIFQSGDLAVVSGIHKTERTGQDGNPVMGQVACTYTFQRRQGKWMFVACQQTAMQQDQPGSAAADEAAIKTTLETETRAFHEANGDLLQAQWSTKPYAERQHANLEAALGAPYVKGDKLRSFGDSYFKTLKPSGETTRISDYDVHISGAMAWATYTQERLDKAMTVVAKQREIRVLERETTGWKIVFLGLQPMK